ncbi:hypothetical protein DBT_0437 [Dissulfuribacter thermophilus]|uniref:Uncharacterized protein n=1 Tax=Dissulfuribacter thermophilus TaxID=1156395 RepID=A0A1B9F840_9BACT|nr:hypothetical protein DBT_0437 [Dissulfuribacter thermophilus]
MGSAPIVPSLLCLYRRCPPLKAWAYRQERLFLKMTFFIRPN